MAGKRLVDKKPRKKCRGGGTFTWHQTAELRIALHLRHVCTCAWKRRPRTHFYNAPFGLHIVIRKACKTSLGPRRRDASRRDARNQLRLSCFLSIHSVSSLTFFLIFFLPARFFFYFLQYFYSTQICKLKHIRGPGFLSMYRFYINNLNRKRTVGIRRELLAN